MAIFDRPPQRGALPLHDAARWLGRAVWRELRAFEVLGGWVQKVPQPEAKILLDGTARHCAWRAELLGEQLPRLREPEVERLVAPEGEHVERFFEMLAGAPSAAGGDVAVGNAAIAARMAGVFRVLLPRAVTSTSARLARAVPVADAPLMRVLRLVLDDQARDWQAGEELLQTLLADETAVLTAAGWQGQLEVCLVAGGGLA